MINTAIGSFIAALRREQGLTQEQLAEKLGVSNRSISRWENGNTLPDYSLLQALSGVLKVSTAELLAGQRLPQDTCLEDCVHLAMELAQREKDALRQSLNRCFGTGLAFLLGGISLRNLTTAPGSFSLLCAGLAMTFFFAGFWKNNSTSLAVSTAVLTADSFSLRMKTAAEMVQFSMQHQRNHKKQHRLGFEAIERQLLGGEYAVFAFIGDSSTLNDVPGAWHISAAITNTRFLLAGENMRGVLLPVYHVEDFGLETFRSSSLQGSCLTLRFGSSIIKIDGSNLSSVSERLRDYLQ